MVIKEASQFMDWKMDDKLLDIPFHGVNYTQTNNRSNESAIYERIDKAFSNQEWRNLFPYKVLWNLPILLSDYSPIVLHFQEKCQGKKLRPYRLDTWSLEHAEVFKIIEEEWKHIHTGSSSHVLQRKLQNTMRRIRSWCLEYTKKNKIDWKAITNNLTEH